VDGAGESEFTSWAMAGLKLELEVGKLQRHSPLSNWVGLGKAAQPMTDRGLAEGK
jgi:hypothetical protein